MTTLEILQGIKNWINGKGFLTNSNVDEEPTAGSNNLVKSGGVFRNLFDTKKIKGQDNTYIAEDYFGVVAGRTYKIVFSNPNWEIPNSSSVYILRILALDVNSEILTDIVTIQSSASNSRKPYYIFNIPNGTYCIRVGLRALSTETVEYSFYDVTDFFNLGDSKEIFYALRGFDNVANGWITASGKSSQVYVGGLHSVIPVEEGDNVIISPNTVNGISVIAFLSSYSKPLANDISYSLVAGTSRTTISQTTTYTVPSGANYLLVALNNSSEQNPDYSPSFLKINDRIVTGLKVDTTPSLNSPQPISSDAVCKISNDIYGYSSTPTLEQGSISGTNGSKVSSNNRIRVKELVQVKGKFKVHINNSGYLYYLFYYPESTTEYTGATRQSTAYTSSDTIDSWKGYISYVIKNTDGTSIVPSDTSVTVTFESIIPDDAPATINVKNMGAVGDGVADDTNAIATAISHGGRIYIPDGTYLISSRIPLSSNTHIIMSKGATLLRNADINVIFYTPFESTTTLYNGVKNIILEGGTLDMGELTNGGTPLGLCHAENVTVQNVTFKRNHAGSHNIDCCGVKHLKIIECIFTGALSTNQYAELIQIDSPQSYTSFPIAYNGDYPCWDNTPCRDVEICGCTFELNAYSPAIGNHSAGEHKYINIHDNLIIGYGVNSNNDRGAFAFGVYSGYTTENITDLVNIHDNIVTDCKFGFEILTPNTFVVKNNIFRNIGTMKTTSSGDNGTFDNNIIENL